MAVDAVLCELISTLIPDKKLQGNISAFSLIKTITPVITPKIKSLSVIRNYDFAFIRELYFSAA